MTVAFLTASASRQAGGLFDALRRLAGETASLPDVRLMAFAVEDAHTQADRPAWDGVALAIASPRGPRSFGYAPSLVRRLNEARPDLVHQHGLWMYPSVACDRWARQAGRPYLVSPHGMLDPWAVRNSGWKKRIAGWLYEDAHLRRAACLHALCEAEARAIRAYGLKNPVCVIPNGVDLPSASPARRDSEVRTVLYIGRLHPKKNLLNLLRAWALVRHEATARQWRLVIAGWDQDGYESRLRQAGRELGLGGQVVFAGPQFDGNKDTTLRSADAFLLPSYSEGLPMTVLEAWSYGLPVVMTPECNVPEGFQAEAALRIGTSPESISIGLQALFGMSAMDLQGMGHQGRRLVVEKFSWPQLGVQMKMVYDWILGGGPKPDCCV